MIELANGMSLPEQRLSSAYNTTKPFRLLRFIYQAAASPTKYRKMRRFLSASVKETVKAYIIRHLD